MKKQYNKCKIIQTSYTVMFKWHQTCSISRKYLFNLFVVCLLYKFLWSDVCGYVPFAVVLLIIIQKITETIVWYHNIIIINLYFYKCTCVLFQNQVGIICINKFKSTVLQSKIFYFVWLECDVDIDVICNEKQWISFVVSKHVMLTCILVKKVHKWVFSNICQVYFFTNIEFRYLSWQPWL